ncbi:MAG: hypothetical protein HZC40_04500 [Chloroflexi bacterium]|nr:hypothetical protein [Chloroflexota bacterium]
MKHLLFGVGLVLALMLMFGNPQVVSAQSPASCVFVKETSHNIHGAFLVFYDSHNGPVDFGPPLSEAFIENGTLVQYFTFARLEFIPTNPEPYRVTLGLLGMTYGITDPPVQSIVIPHPNDLNFKYFPETGLIIGFAIKDYWLAHGGMEIVGYPVSQLRYENGMFVQYFQRARLEWNPADNGPNKVRKSPIGQIVLDKKYAADQIWRAPAVKDWCPDPIGARLLQTATPILRMPTPVPPTTEMAMHVQLHFPATPTRGPQYVEVFVDDRGTKSPLKGVALYAAIQSVRGTRHIPLLATDERGKTSFSFDLGNQPAGSLTTVTVYAFLGSLTTTASESFSHQ